MARRSRATFDPKAFLATVNHGRTISSYAKDDVVFRQGSPADAAQGKQIFANKCAVCHDADTRDTQVGPGLKDLFHWPAHSLSDGTVHQQHTVETIRKQIVEGGGLMEPVGASFSDQEIADLIAYLRTL